MNILALFFLGIIQGLTEFLPVSSSGHLVLFSTMFGVEESLFVSIILHVATLLSICAVFYKDLWKILRHPFSRETMLFVSATIPTCVIVLVLLPIIKKSFGGQFLAVCFIVSATLLYVAEKSSRKSQEQDIDFQSAIIIGIAQGFAVFPGISRSGSTISAGLLCGKNRQKTAKFSFLLSVPIIFLSLVTEVFEICTNNVIVNVSIMGMILAFVTAFIVGVFAIKFMIKVTEKTSLRWFSLYLLAIAVLTFFIL